MKQITNQQKKELFQVLIPYFESKPEDQWCTGMYNTEDGRHCALGFLSVDFSKGVYFGGDVFIIVNRASKYELAIVNDNKNVKYEHLPTPKQRVLAYLNDQVKSL